MLTWRPGAAWRPAATPRPAAANTAANIALKAPGKCLAAVAAKIIAPAGETLNRHLPESTLLSAHGPAATSRPGHRRAARPRTSTCSPCASRSEPRTHRSRATSGGTSPWATADSHPAKAGCPPDPEARARNRRRANPEMTDRKLNEVLCPRARALGLDAK